MFSEIYLGVCSAIINKLLHLLFDRYNNLLIIVELTPQPVKCYNHKMRDSKFLKVDDSLIAEAMSVFSAPPVFSGVVTCLVQSQKWPIGFSPSLELVNSEE
jgi:hypothetical protein